MYTSRGVGLAGESPEEIGQGCTKGRRGNSRKWERNLKLMLFFAIKVIHFKVLEVFKKILDIFSVQKTVMFFILINYTSII